MRYSICLYEAKLNIEILFLACNSEQIRKEKIQSSLKMSFLCSLICVCASRDHWSLTNNSQLWSISFGLNMMCATPGVLNVHNGCHGDQFHCEIISARNPEARARSGCFKDLEPSRDGRGERGISFTLPLFKSQ